MSRLSRKLLPTPIRPRFPGPSIAAHLAVTGQSELLQDNPVLDRSLRMRVPYLDPLNHIQVEFLKLHRAANSQDEQILRGIQLTINGISAGLRNSG